MRDRAYPEGSLNVYLGDDRLPSRADLSIAGILQMHDDGGSELTLEDLVSIRVG